MNTYFILSQFCDWNTQTIVNACSALAAASGACGDELPTAQMREVAMGKSRTGDLNEKQFMALPWFAAKILTADRPYIFHDNRPQVDHIFPLGLANAEPNYRDVVDVLWNLQPIRNEINNFKRAKHPQRPGYCRVLRRL